MKRTLLLGKDSQDVELLHLDGVTSLVWEGQSHPIDILELEPGCYSILMEGRSVEVRLDQAKSPDPEAHAYRAMLYDGAYEFSLVDPGAPCWQGLAGLEQAAASWLLPCLARS